MRRMSFQYRSRLNVAGCRQHKKAVMAEIVLQQFAYALLGANDQHVDGRLFVHKRCWP